MEDPLISGIAHHTNEAKITILGAPDIPGVAAKILGPISDANIEVDMIVQNVSPDGKSTDFSFTVGRGDYKKAYSLVEACVAEMGAGKILGDTTMAKVSLVGVGMRSHAGVASKMFKTLAENSINIRMVSTSEIKISVVIDEKFTELAVRTLHTAFGLDKPE